MHRYIGILDEGVSNLKRRGEEMMIKKAISVLMGALLALSLAGCATSQNQSQSQSQNQHKNQSKNQSKIQNQNQKHTQTKSSNQSSQAKKSSKNTAMKNTKTGNQNPLAKIFKNELNGLTTVGQDVNKGNYTSAIALSNNLHSEFQTVILPKLIAKKGKTYAETIHGKYNNLQSAITNKNKTKIIDLIKVNQVNLNTIAPALGVSLK